MARRSARLQKVRVNHTCFGWVDVLMEDAGPDAVCRRVDEVRRQLAHGILTTCGAPRAPGDAESSRSRHEERSEGRLSPLCVKAPTSGGNTTQKQGAQDTARFRRQSHAQGPHTHQGPGPRNAPGASSREHGQGAGRGALAGFSVAGRPNSRRCSGPRDAVKDARVGSRAKSR